MARILGPIFLVGVGLVLMGYATLFGFLVWRALNPLPGYVLVSVSGPIWVVPIVVAVGVLAGLSCWYGAYRWFKQPA